MTQYIISKKRLGQKTKGLTCENRLRQIDNFICMNFEWLICRKDSLFVDIGFGKYPTTTIETHRKLAFINPNVKAIGVEIDKERLLSAKAYESENVEFRLCGFNIPLNKGEFASIIRCYNVLRQYPEEDFDKSIDTMGYYLSENGIIVEGTSDQFGRLVSFNIFVKTNGNLFRRCIVFGTSFNMDFYPKDFQSVLPKNLIHHVIKGEWVYQFFDDWNDSFYRAIRLGLRSQKQVFYETAIILSKDYGYNIWQTKRLLKRGFLVVNV